MDFWSASRGKFHDGFRNASFLCPAPNWKTSWNDGNKQMYKSCKTEVLFGCINLASMQSFWINMFAMLSMTHI
jgi:hypothetical protein